MTTEPLRLVDFHREFRDHFDGSPLHEKDWALYGIKLANLQHTEEVGDLAWFFHIAARGLLLRSGQAHWYRTQVIGIAGATERWFEALKPHRDWLRGVLEDFLVDRESARAKHGVAIDKRVRQMMPLGLLDFSGGTIGARQVVVAESDEAVTGYMAALLLDREKPFGTRLGRCRLEECGAFFLVPEERYRGSRNAFCSPAHTEKGKRRQAADRQKKRRARQKEVA